MFGADGTKHSKSSVCEIDLKLGRAILIIPVKIYLVPKFYSKHHEWQRSYIVRRGQNLKTKYSYFRSNVKTKRKMFFQIYERHEKFKTIYE